MPRYAVPVGGLHLFIPGRQQGDPIRAQFSVAWQRCQGSKICPHLSPGNDLFIQYFLDDRPIHAGLAKFSPPFGNFGFLQFDNLIWHLADVSEDLHLPSGAALEVT